MKSFKEYILESLPTSPYGKGNAKDFFSPHGDHDGDGIDNQFDSDYPYDVDWNDPDNPTDDEVQSPLPPLGFPIPGPHPGRWPYVPLNPSLQPGRDNPFVRPKQPRDIHPSLQDVRVPPGWPGDVLTPFDVPGPSKIVPIPSFPGQGQQPGDMVT